MFNSTSDKLDFIKKWGLLILGIILLVSAIWQIIGVSIGASAWDAAGAYNRMQILGGASCFAISFFVFKLTTNTFAYKSSNREKFFWFIASIDIITVFVSVSLLLFVLYLMSSAIGVDGFRADSIFSDIISVWLYILLMFVSIYGVRVSFRASRFMMSKTK